MESDIEPQIQLARKLVKELEIIDTETAKLIKDASTKITTAQLKKRQAARKQYDDAIASFDSAK